MHRFHWVTIVKVNSFKEDYLKKVIRWSYQKALASLPKRIQAEVNTHQE